jgi:3',5'-cyclic AMP phosphodiesterase CpdA
VAWLLLILVLGAWLPNTATAQPARVVAIGDIHGAAGPFRALLETVGLTDSSQRWTGGRATLVHTGDFMDRGAGVKAVIDLLMRLETEASEAGGRVIVLLGNHEVMNLMAITRDTTPELLGRFATPQSETRRDDAFEAYIALLEDRAVVLGPLATDPLPYGDWMEAHPPGFIEYMDAFGPDGTYGRWLRAKSVVVRVGDTLLLHGGLHPDPTKAPSDLDKINERARREIETSDHHRERLIEHGIILPFYTSQETNAAVRRELEAWAIRVAPEGPPAPVALTSEDREQIEMLLAVQNDVSTWSVLCTTLPSGNQSPGCDGPVWYRDFARWADDEGLPLARSLTERYGVTRFVVGHTIPANRLITARFDDQVFLIDTGMLTAHYAGRASALEIAGDAVTAVYLDRRVPLVETPRP